MKWLLLLAATACTAGESSTPPPGGPTPSLVRLVGTIDGAAGARVSAGGKSATVRADGSYTLDGLPEGGTVVVASASGAHDEVAAATLTPPETRLDLTLSPTAGSLELVFTGDAAFTSRIRAVPDGESDWADLVGPVAPLTRSADVTVVSLEGVIAEPGSPHPGRPVLLASPPSSVGALKALGTDVLMLASDHIYDYLDEGVGDTLDNVRAAGMTPLGAGKTENEAHTTTVVTKNGVSVGLVAFSLLTGRGEELPVTEPPFFDADGGKAGSARFEAQRLDAAVADLRGKADHVVVLLHGGHERATAPGLDVATAAHRAIDAGAALVVASHPRLVQGVERYKDKLIFYGLGGLVLDDDEPEGWMGAVLRVRLPKSGAAESVRLDPVYTEGLAPSAATGGLRRRILAAFAERSAPLGVTVLSDGRVVAQGPADMPASTSTGERAGPVEALEGAVISFAEDIDGDARLSRLELLAPPDATLWLGRDLLLTGSLEDDLADDKYGAPAGFRFPSDAEQIVTGSSGGGRLSLSICRSGTARDVASTESSGRFPVGSSATITLCGCWRGDAGTTAAAKVVFYGSLGEDARPVETRAVVSGAPPRDWECFCHAASGPKHTRFAEVRLEHTPTADHSACVGFDALRLIGWEQQPPGPVTLAPRSNVSIVRVTGAAGSAEARVGYELRTLEAP